MAQSIDIGVDAVVADGRGELRLDGVAEGLSVSPDGSLWLTSGDGESFRAESVDGDWRKGELRAVGDRRHGRTIDRVTFFNEVTAIATGYLYGDSRDSYLLRTTDRGESWRTIETPLGWVYDVQTTPRGEAWLGGSDGDFLQSSDFGATWRERAPPFGPSARTFSIAMIDGRRGFVGALADSLARTDDSGRTWKAVPTPHGQGLIGRVAPRVHSSIADMRISLALCGRYLLASQGGEAFVSDTAAIAWRSLSRIGAIVRSPSAYVAFGITHDGFVVRIDSGLRQTTVSDEPITTPVHSITASLAGVYILDWNGGVHHVREGSTTFAFPVRGDDDAITITGLSGNDRVLWGTSERYLYRSEDEGEHWTRIDNQPNPRTLHAGLRAISDDVVLIRHRDSGVTRYDHRSRTFTRCDLDSIEVLDFVRVNDWWLAVGRRELSSASVRSVADTFAAFDLEPDMSHRGHLFRSRDGLEWQKIVAHDSAEIDAIYGRGSDSIVVVANRRSVLITLSRPSSGDALWEMSASKFDHPSHGTASGRISPDGGWFPQFDSAHGALLYRAAAPPRTSMFRSPYAIERFRAIGTSHLIATERHVYLVDAAGAREIYSTDNDERIVTVEIIGDERAVVGVKDFDSELYGTFWEELDLRW